MHENILYLVNIPGISIIRDSHWIVVRVSNPKGAPALCCIAARDLFGFRLVVLRSIPGVLSSLCLIPPPSNRSTPLQLSWHSHALCAVHLTEPAHEATSHRHACGQRAWHGIARLVPRPPRVVAPRISWRVLDITGVGGWLLRMPDNSEHICG